jgi:hypothetical protein
MIDKNIKIDRFIFNEIPTKKVNDKIILDADGQNIAYQRLKKDEVEFLENKLSEITDFLTVPKITNTPLVSKNENRQIQIVLLNFIEPKDYEKQLNISYKQALESNPYLKGNDFIERQLILTQNYLERLLTDLDSPDKTKFIFTTKSVDNRNILGLDTDEKRYFFFIRNSPKFHDHLFLFDYLKEINSILKNDISLAKKITEQSKPIEKIALSNSIDNLRNVYRRVNSFIFMLKVNDKTDFLKTCSEFRRDREFLDVCHRAKKEIETLYINENEKIIETYKDKFVKLNEELMQLFDNYYNERSEKHNINSSLFHVREVFNVLNTYSSNKEVQTKTLDNSQPNQIEEKQKEVFTFENNFDNIEPKDVYSHFKAGLVDKRHIDLETLEVFLKQAFNDYTEDKPPKDKIRMKNTKHKIGYIRGVFHKYFLEQTLQHSEKFKYVKLLTDNFIDFDYQKTHDNFRS